MPHTDRAQRLAYLREHHQRHRPAPEPSGDEYDTLTAYDAIEF